MPTICAGCGDDYPKTLAACPTCNSANPDRLGLTELPPDLFWTFILPALDPAQSAQLAQVNRQARANYTDPSFRENAMLPPLGARVADFMGQHARLMRNPNTTAVEVQRHLGAGNRLRGVVHNLPMAAENPSERRDAQLALLQQARRSLLNKLGELKPLAVVRR